MGRWVDRFFVGTGVMISVIMAGLCAVVPLQLKPGLREMLGFAAVVIGRTTRSTG